MKITKDTLEKLRNNSKSQESKSMFIEGRFNRDNWNGGDSILREVLNELLDEKLEIRQTVYIGDDYYDVIITTQRHDDNSYGIVIINNDEDLTTYTFSWYKNKGRTDYAKVGDRDITEDEYIFILNLIEKAGFRFSSI